jgi:hypothetical protein
MITENELTPMQNNIFEAIGQVSRDSYKSGRCAGIMQSEIYLLGQIVCNPGQSGADLLSSFKEWAKKNYPLV